jgi:hypothetical protein
MISRDHSDERNHIMETPIQNSATRNQHLIGGMVLIALGVFFLLERVLNLGWLVLPLLAGLFLLTGALTRQSGWFIPAGILGGLSAGIYLNENVSQLAGDEARGGAFLLAFALGWISIPVLSKLLTRDDIHWWALIPGGIMALIGSATLLGGAALRVREYIQYGWPLALIVAGLYFLLRRAAPPA